MAVLPALGAESYGRAYQPLLKLHMMQEVADTFTQMQRVREWFQ
jgi:hypothetical protein